MTMPDLKEMDARIQSMKRAADALDQLGGNFPAINRNIVRIRASIKMLEINVSDILDLDDSSPS